MNDEAMPTGIGTKLNSATVRRGRWIPVLFPSFGGLVFLTVGLVFAASLSFAASGAFDGNNTIAQSRRKPRSSGAQTKGGASSLQFRSYEFDTVTVNSSGAITKRRKGHARYYVEDTKGVALELVEIPGGTFAMGDDSEKPVHNVTVPSFYMGKYEVTQAQWKAVAKLPRVRRNLNPDPSYFIADKLPVESVSWDDAMEFCARLSKAAGRTYRLPSEAEWEYACRAGTTTEFGFGENITPELENIDGHHPYLSAPGGVARMRTTPVGSFGVANGFGLYDMHGNVYEWCLDSWHFGYDGAPTDGSAWDVGGDPSVRVQIRVHRGGAYDFGASFCSSTRRSGNSSDTKSRLGGFRVVAVATTR